MPVLIASKKPNPRKEPVVLAFDISTLTGVAVSQGKEVRETYEFNVTSAGGHHVPLMQRMSRCNALHKHVVALFDKYNDPDTAISVMIEGYAFGMGPGQSSTISTQIELGTMVRAAAFHRAIPMFEVAPSTLKKFATSDGSAKKEMMRVGVFKKWQFEHPSNNVVDAYALMRLGMCLAKVVPPLDHYEQDSVNIVARRGVK